MLKRQICLIKRRSTDWDDLGFFVLSVGVVSCGYYYSGCWTVDQCSKWAENREYSAPLALHFHFGQVDDDGQMDANECESA